MFNKLENLIFPIEHQATERPMLSTFSSSLTKKPLFSLSNISNVFESLHADRAQLDHENAQIIVQRKKLHSELQEIEATLRQLYNRKSIIETNLEALSVKEIEVQENRELLDKKIQTIGEESIRFEQSIKSISSSTNKTDFVPQTIQNTKVFNGHSSAVTTVKIDGIYGRIVSGSSDMTVKLWETETNQCKGTLIAHQGGIRTVAFSDTHVVSGSTDCSIRIWDSMNGECTQILSSHSAPVNCVQFDTKQLVSGSDDSTVKVWDMERGQCVNTFTKNVPVKCLQFYAHALTTGGDNIVRMWDTRSGQCCRQLAGHTDMITCLQFDEYSLVSGSSDQTVRFWDIRTGTCQKTLETRSPVNSLCFSANYLVVGVQENDVHVYSTATLHHKWLLKGATQEILSVKQHDKLVVGGCKDNSIYLWELP